MSWKSKGLQYISQRTGLLDDPQKQTWKEWAGNKLKLVGPGASSLNEERIILFPGWSARRFHTSQSMSTEGAFSVDIFVSGYSSSHRPPQFATRSQRAFIRLAKSFAALPTLAAKGPGSSDTDQILTSPSTKELLKTTNLPPRPEEVTEDVDIEVLEHQFQKANRLSITDSEFENPSDSRPSSLYMDDNRESTMYNQPTSSSVSLAAKLEEDLAKLHMNLEKRLQPFWSTVIPSRDVRVHIFATHSSAEKYQTYLQSTGPEHYNPSFKREELPDPIASQKLVTEADGSFQALFRLSWEKLCLHPEALHIAFGNFDKEETHEHDFYVVAELMAPPPPPTPSVSYSPYKPRPHRTQASFSPNPSGIAGSKSRPVAVQAIPLTFSAIRVISDIDDTVKVANVVSGARSIFHTVFVKDLADNVIPGMPEWYTSLWQKGVRFHYVSNSPFELLPVIQEFFQKAGLPLGSIKLRSYAGRSLFSGLLTAPAARKRSNVLEILNAFPDSRFVLIGDSGEHDLELYVEIASQLPEQVLAIFIRDVENDAPAIPDPTGASALGSYFTPSAALPNITSPTPGMPPSPRPPSYFPPALEHGEPSRSQSDSDVMPPRRSVSWASVERTNVQDNSSLPPMLRAAEPEPIPTMMPQIHASLSDPPVAVDDAWAPTAWNPPNSALPTTNRSNGQQPLSPTEQRRISLQNRVWRARTLTPEAISLRIFRDPKECIEMDSLMLSQ